MSRITVYKKLKDKIGHEKAMELILIAIKDSEPHLAITYMGNNTFKYNEVHRPASKVLQLLLRTYRLEEALKLMQKAIDLYIKVG